MQATKLLVYASLQLVGSQAVAAEASGVNTSKAVVVLGDDLETEERTPIIEGLKKAGYVVTDASEEEAKFSGLFGLSMGDLNMRTSKESEDSKKEKIHGEGDIFQLETSDDGESQYDIMKSHED